MPIHDDPTRRKPQVKNNAFPSSMHADLKHYVYVYIDLSGALEKVIHVGKGVGNRCFAHLKTSAENAKSATIRQLNHTGKLRIGWPYEQPASD